MELIKIISVIYVYIYLLSSASALSCIPCNRSKCIDKKPSDCTVGTASDVCGCCKVCLKDEDEICGGPFNIHGDCGDGLICRFERIDDFNSNGKCVLVALPMKIIYKEGFQYEEIWNDIGSGGSQDVSIWRSTHLPSGFCSLGDVAHGEHSQPSIRTILVSKNTLAAVHPSSFTQVWNDGGSGHPWDCAVYRMNAPSGYTCLGGVAMRSHRDQPDKDSYCCIIDNLLVPGNVVETYKDHGTGARQHLSLWTVVKGSDTHGIPGGNFLPVNGYNKPSKGALLDGQKATKENPSLITCERFELNIECEVGQVINVIQASYGRSSLDICTDGPVGTESSLNCHSESSQQVLNYRCNGNRRCTVAASNEIFGDPCRGIYKYLEVDFICEPSENPSLIACEHLDLNIECEVGQVINVIQASYGRSSLDICTDGPVGTESSLNCHSESSQQVLNDRCNGNRHCTVAASNEIFGDPCRGVYKYLEVDFICEPATCFGNGNPCEWVIGGTCRDKCEPGEIEQGFCYVSSSNDDQCICCRQSSNPEKFIIEYERFIILENYKGVTWQEAQRLCELSSFELAQPHTNVTKLASYLLDNYGESFYWLGGRGTGSNIAYLSGEVIPPTSPLWRNDEAGFQSSTDYCLYIRAVDDGTITNPLGTFSCIDTIWLTPLCEARKFDLGSETFIVLHEYRGVSWSQASNLCKSAGYELAEPKIEVGLLASHLLSYFGFTYYWLGGKGQGSYIAYTMSGVVIESNSPLWRNDEVGLQTSMDYCMYIRDDGIPNPLGTYSCQDKTLMTPLCEAPPSAPAAPAVVQLPQIILDRNMLN